MSDLTGISSQQQEQILKIPASVKTGVVVRGVEAATPAEKAGLEKYTIFTELMPMTCPSILISGPPEFPGLMAASV